MASVKSATVGVFGFGNVGRTLARQVMDVGLRVGLVADSSAVLVSKGPKGFSRDALKAIGDAKAAGQRLADVSGDFVAHNSPSSAIESFASHENPVVADCSAFESPEPYLLPALDRGIPIALANKKPLTGSFNWYKALVERPELIGYEATCGAGLPVICSADRLLDSGDEMTRIEGQLSGTLGYILSALEGGGRFSDIVAEAKSLGFTEPDPRDDLSGTDVARKAMILARKFGGDAYGEMADIVVESLYPEEFASLSLDEFMNRLPELDGYFADKISAANAEGKKLRYAAVVEPNKTIQVGLQMVPSDSPLASLKGTDNLVSFSTKWYDTNPLVVRGPGAGLEVTAAGVLADVAVLCHKNYSK